MIDFDSPFKRLWATVSCGSACPRWGGRGSYCNDHTDLLKLVDAYAAVCGTNYGRAIASRQWGEINVKEIRRRLRAVVGVEGER